MCGVCIFHAWYKTKSDACCKPRLVQATLLQEPESHNMRHLPWCSSSSNDIELGILAKSHTVAEGTSGFLFALQRGAFFLALFFWKGLEEFLDGRFALRVSAAFVFLKSFGALEGLVDGRGFVRGHELHQALLRDNFMIQCAVRILEKKSTAQSPHCFRVRPQRVQFFHKA